MDKIDLVSIINSIVQFGSYGPPGWIAAGVLLLITIVGAFFLNRYLNKLKAEMANKQTDEDRSKAISGIAQKGKEVERDSNKAADEIDLLIKGKK